ncbi:MAG: hypothetical protein JWM78_2977 [Verrucomicrobiaceae bacterium]|nr:hypothetical protein [Verrucomicrobiaceae bacterium]
MAQESAVNLNSLALIREELDTTIQRAAGELEAFLLDATNTGAAENCYTDVSQVAGTLRLIQFTAGALLAEEMADALKDIATASGASAEALAGALSHAFFVLPRYIEFVTTRHFADPILIIPYANELRVARRKPLIPEFQFETRSFGLLPVHALPDSVAAPNKEALERLRQMYQVGLLAILRQKNQLLNLQLIARAAARFANQMPTKSGDGIWHLAAAVADSMARGGLSINLNRRRTLGTIERLMSRYLKGGDTALAAVLDDSIRHELIFLLAISSYRDDSVKTTIDAFAIPHLQPDDGELTTQHDAMRGPGLEAIDSVVKVLKEELRSAKDILEIASQNQGISVEELAPLQETLTRVADTLRMVNLKAPANILREQLKFVETWAAQKNGVPAEQFLSVADALLFIESSLSGLYRNKLTAGDLDQVTDAMRKQIVADSQLAEASRIVIDEVQNGIALCKRAITSYVESNFDVAHIANVGTTLTSVRGAAQILNHVRAASILKSCAAFVEAHVRDKQQSGPQRHQLLETLADALISLEYYFTELAASRVPDEKILTVAEESLAALGYAVSP